MKSTSLLDHEFIQRQFAADDLAKILDERLAICKLTWSLFLVIAVVADLQSPTQVAIAGLLHQSEPAVSRQLRVLVQRELIVRRANPTNRRESLVRLTKTGETVYADAQAVVRRVFGRYKYK